MYTENSNNGGFLTGMVAGAAVGLGLGMLFAPRAGAEVRRTIAGSASDLKQAAAETYRQASGRVRDMVDRGRDAAEDLVDKGRDQALDYVDRGADAVKEAARTAQGTLDSALRAERRGYDRIGADPFETAPSGG